MRGQIVDKGRFVHAGYGMNALFGLQKQANSIYCRDDVDTGKRSASGNFAFYLHSQATYMWLYF
ncbi:FIG00640343: hypothetical protein [Escherichia coli ISC7]|uniref:Uncharacterized protein n=1 Tax=Escherichia coli ISC7 TaxID=1432555 RepID=W1ESM4_ECOLX|nr:FIG00640343: hypothetical protein [Escherichia coli ISC7]